MLITQEYTVKQRFYSAIVLSATYGSIQAWIHGILAVIIGSCLKA